ncbi:hypothetical protein NDA01_21715 [Trichocoleus desertorum AS-A10]|uniref:hypothetical protein n=1 Tax=Trichocoleus desertorum TaxID=1481672 RepID=UPI00329683B2
MSKTIKRTLIAFALLLPIAALPVWGKWIWPQIFSDQVCVLQAPDGTITKAQGVACSGGTGL